MVDSRAKGQRGEYLVRDRLREHTKLQFERVPNSGALEYLKGDLYVPNENNIYLIECKNYEQSAFTDKMFTQDKTNHILVWWRKAVLQAASMKQLPLVIFKYDRSKLFVLLSTKPTIARHIYISWIDAYCCVLDEWLEQDNPRFINGS
jgi:hypothetical protein